jgi:hypothetical protein
LHARRQSQVLSDCRKHLRSFITFPLALKYDDTQCLEVDCMENLLIVWVIVSMVESVIDTKCGVSCQKVALISILGAASRDLVIDGEGVKPIGR